MSTALRQPDGMTADQFRDWPGDGVNRLHQLIDGEPVAMSPPSWRHSVLMGELGRRLGNHLAEHDPGCLVGLEPGVRPRAGAAHNVRVPDLAVSCRPVEGHWMADPVLVVKILSPSNLRETREAVRAYLTIPSVREVWIVDSRAVAAEVLARDPDGGWPEEPTRLGEGDVLASASFGFSVPLRDLSA